MKITGVAITARTHGHYRITVYTDEGSKTVGAAKSSPVAQCIRLLERLLQLSDSVAGYRQ